MQKSTTGLVPLLRFVNSAFKPIELFVEEAEGAGIGNIEGVQGNEPQTADLKRIVLCIGHEGEVVVEALLMHIVVSDDGAPGNR